MALKPASTAADVYKRMLQQGWDKKPGVRIVFGRWQDVIGQLGQYDGVFFDTYSEFYEDLRYALLGLLLLLPSGHGHGFVK